MFKTKIMKHKIDHIHISDWYDQPLTGWLRTNGKYYYFHISYNIFDDTGDYAYHLIYDIEPQLKLQHLKRVRAWRHMMGWNEDSPHKVIHNNRNRDFYNLPKPEEINIDDYSAIGIALDFTEIELF
jgi:hypothetical protein